MSDLESMCNIDKGTYTDAPVLTADIRKLFKRIAELEQQLTELRGELTTVQNAHSKALANNTALRKWITKLEGK